MRLSAANARIVIIKDGHLIRGNRIGVAASDLARQAPCILKVYPGAAAEERRAVRAIPLAEGASGTVAIGADLASTLGLDAGANVPWEIDSDSCRHVVLADLSLEMTIEQPLERAVDELARSKDLCGTLLLLGADEEAAGLSVESDGGIYRVRSISPAAARETAILEIAETTRLQLFAPGAKSGVDIVILADCSGSMGASDLTETEPVGGIRGLFQGKASLRRDEALRKSLRRLLDLRLNLAGRVSRMAIVAFDRECIQRFPRGGGMREMDETSAGAVEQEFRDAIGLLKAHDAGTDIGQALQYAAELLYRNGHPANDRLIVLISDGAHWKPKGEEGTGEETVASSEPVSLMSHLHHDMKIHLHAIGISNETIYRRWFDIQPENRGRQPEIGMIPNHALLEELVKVGGGDPSRTGDTNILEEYFTGLGTGVMRRVASPRATPLPKASAEEVSQFAAAARQAPASRAAPDFSEDVHRIVGEIRGLFDDCNKIAIGRISRPLFRATYEGSNVLLTLDKRVEDEAQFNNFAIEANQLFWESRDLKAVDAFGSDAVRAVIKNDGRLRDLNVVRIVAAHNTELPPPGEDRDNRSRRKQHAEILMRLIGVEIVEHDNVDGWAKLHLALLIEIRDVLRDLREACRTKEAAEPPAQQATTEFTWPEDRPRAS